MDLRRNGTGPLNICQSQELGSAGLAHTRSLEMERELFFCETIRDGDWRGRDEDLSGDGSRKHWDGSQEEMDMAIWVRL